MEGRKVRDAADARACLAQADASGLPRRVWAREHRVDARSLNAWRIILERRGRSHAHLVELVAARPASPSIYRIRCGEFEVETTGDFDDESLGRLLRVVAAC